MSLRPFLRFRVSRPGLFYDLSTGDSCPLRIPPTSRGLRFPPLISREKHGGLPTVTQKRSQSHTAYISATGVSPWVSTEYCLNVVALKKTHIPMREKHARFLIYIIIPQNLQIVGVYYSHKSVFIKPFSCLSTKPSSIHIFSQKGAWSILIIT